MAQVGLGLPQGDAQYLFYREAAVTDGVSAGQGFWVWVGWGEAVVPVPLPSGGPFLPGTASLPFSLWAGLTPAGPEQGICCWHLPLKCIGTYL